MTLSERFLTKSSRSVIQASKVIHFRSSDHRIEIGHFCVESRSNLYKKVTLNGHFFGNFQISISSASSVVNALEYGARLLILITPPSPEDTLLKSQNLTERIMNTFLFLKNWCAKRAEKNWTFLTVFRAETL